MFKHVQSQTEMTLSTVGGEGTTGPCPRNLTENRIARANDVADADHVGRKPGRTPNDREERHQPENA